GGTGVAASLLGGASRSTGLVPGRIPARSTRALVPSGAEAATICPSLTTAIRTAGSAAPGTSVGAAAIRTAVSAPLSLGSAAIVGSTAITAAAIVGSTAITAAAILGSTSEATAGRSITASAPLPLHRLVTADLAPVERRAVHRLQRLLAVLPGGIGDEAEASRAASLLVSNNTRLFDRADLLERRA